MEKSQKIVVVAFVAIGLFLALLDGTVNGYWKLFSPSQEVATVATGQFQKEWITAAGLTGTGGELHETYQTESLFGIIPAGSGGYVHELTNGINSFARVYEFSGGEMTYFGIKEQIAALFPKAHLVNETNSYGKYSFYFNPSERKETVFLVMQSGQITWGFQFPKKNYAEMKKLIQFISNQ